MKSIRKSAKGFTFVELIVVMAIIAVLTATLVIAVGAFLRDKKYDDANAKAEVVYRALQIKLNQYDAEGHKTTAGTEGIGGIERKQDKYIYIGNFDIITANADIVDRDGDGDTSEIGNIGVCSYDIQDLSGDPVLPECDLGGFVTDFDMGDTIRTLYTSKDGVNWNPSWMAKIDMETYTVEYVLYTEDQIQLRDNFMNRSTTDDEGYYKDIYEQQSSAERARLNYNVVGCYPMQSFYD